MNESRGMPHANDIERMLASAMRADITRGPWWSRLWARVAFASGSVIVLSTAVAAVVLLSQDSITETRVVYCLEGPYRTADGELSGSAASIGTPGGVLEIRDAVAMCTTMWEAGVFEQDDPLSATPAPGEAPGQFTTCVTDDGSAAIVPGRIECSTLRLHPFQPNVPTGR